MGLYDKMGKIRMFKDKLEWKISHYLQYTSDKNIGKQVYAGFYKHVIKEEIKYIMFDIFNISGKFCWKIYYTLTM